MKRIQFDEEEAAILTYYFIKSVNDEIPRETAIQFASEKLRSRAERKGITIDSSFRSIAGIRLQMLSLEGAFFGGDSKVYEPTRLFTKIANMFNYHKEDFNKLLNQALSK